MAELIRSVTASRPTAPAGTGRPWRSTSGRDEEVLEEVHVRAAAVAARGRHRAQFAGAVLVGEAAAQPAGHAGLHGRRGLAAEVADGLETWATTEPRVLA